MHSLLTLQETTATPIGEGDAGIVLKKDGTFQLFNTHKNFDPSNMTDRQFEQARTLVAFAVALKNPAVMDVLIRISEDPAVVGDVTKLIDRGGAH